MFLFFEIFIHGSKEYKNLYMWYVNLNRKTYVNVFLVKISKKKTTFRENWRIIGKRISATAQQGFNLKITKEKMFMQWFILGHNICKYNMNERKRVKCFLILILILRSQYS
jgi:hypothetical protein